MSPPTDHLPIHLLTTYWPPTNHLQTLLFNFILMITFADSEDEDFNPDNPNSDEDQDVKEE